MHIQSKEVAPEGMLHNADWSLGPGLHIQVAIRLPLVTRGKAGSDSHGLKNLHTLVERFVVQGHRQCQQENGKWVE